MRKAGRSTPSACSVSETGSDAPLPFFRCSRSCAIPFPFASRAASRIRALGTRFRQVSTVGGSVANIGVMFCQSASFFNEVGPVVSLKGAQFPKHVILHAVFASHASRARDA